MNGIRIKEILEEIQHHILLEACNPNAFALNKLSLIFPSVKGISAINLAFHTSFPILSEKYVSYQHSYSEQNRLVNYIDYQRLSAYLRKYGHGKSIKLFRQSSIADMLPCPCSEKEHEQPWEYGEIIGTVKILGIPAEHP